MPALSRRRRAAVGAFLFLATSLLAVAAPAPARAGEAGILAITCTAHKGNTAGWINCSGTGQVRLVIDCTAPQITDYWSGWHVLNGGSTTIGGECNFGINSVGWRTR